MTTINVRIEEKTKRAASKVLSGMGLDLSAGVKLFLNQVVTEQALPFTPSTRDAKKLRAKWDSEAKAALKSGKRYTSGRGLLEDLLK